MKTESPLIFHVYNDKRVKASEFSPFFFRIYNISAMKMHQLEMATKTGVVVHGIFTDTIIFGG